MKQAHCETTRVLTTTLLLQPRAPETALHARLPVTRLSLIPLEGVMDQDGGFGQTPLHSAVCSLCSHGALGWAIKKCSVSYLIF